MEFRVVIPVRYNSLRLPGKALLNIAGKPVIQHVYERAIASKAESVVIATDDERIKKVAEEFGANVCMTSPEHQSGSERLAETVVALGYPDDDVVVNVQGDEPLIPPAIISQVAQDLLDHDNIKVATLCEPIKNLEDLFNPDIVKVTMNRRGYALYFSRAPIPWVRDQFSMKEKQTLNNFSSTEHFRHIGIYAYRVGFLQEYVGWEPCPLESLEKLEQLRVLWNGGRIHVAIAKEKSPIGIDTEEDLEKIRRLVSKK
jgi:3-deoxy-manno-octulosonate cytidylyltransferase (CMP-KDO synthetase)